MTDLQHGSVLELASLCREGQHWQAIDSLGEQSTVNAMGYRRILEARIVADFLAEPGMEKSRPQITSQFTLDYTSFDLSGSEGYLSSLIDGRLTLEKILLISTLGRFTTLLALARLREKGVMTLQS